VAVVEEDFLAQGICDLITNLQKKNQAFKKAREDHDQLVDGSGAPAVIPTPPSHVAAPFAAAAANGAPAAAEPEAVAPPRRASMPLRAVAAVANTPGAMISNLD
jgi:hypothetical protein